MAWCVARRFRRSRASWSGRREVGGDGARRNGGPRVGPSGRGTIDGSSSGTARAVPGTSVGRWLRRCQPIRPPLAAPIGGGAASAGAFSPALYV
jgi:hypothetical protein